ncbi:hypothetical protein PQQ99_37220 [Paraburkholderia sediminicola]|uniref:hypothetical protein n=1 Tax=Paraburkholderia sediminicola TaxID=458836 RepID=UPI0038B6B6B4
MSAAISTWLAHRSELFFWQNFLMFWLPQALAIGAFVSQKSRWALTSGASIALTFLLALCALLFHHADDWLLYIYAVGAALITVLAVGRLSVVQKANPFWCFILGFLAVFLAIVALALVIYGQIVIAAISVNH